VRFRNPSYRYRLNFADAGREASAPKAQNGTGLPLPLNNLIIAQACAFKRGEREVLEKAKWQGFLEQQERK
jgi:hypothetical protein